MAYVIHIVRTESWLDAAIDPITKEQVERSSPRTRNWLGRPKTG